MEKIKKMAPIVILLTTIGLLSCGTWVDMPGQYRKCTSN
jgi:hypothetical protein